MQPSSSVDTYIWLFRGIHCLVIAMAWLAAPALLVAQGEPARTSESVPTRRDAHVGAPNARPTARQRKAIHLLNSAREEAAALDPPMRALVLSEIAKGYERLDLREADTLRKEAFSAAISIENGRTFNPGECFASDACQTKQRLQRKILQSILPRSPALVEELLPSAEANAQRAVVDSLITEYTNRKSFARTEELLARLVPEGGFPYHAARQLMLALPKEDTGSKLTIFAQAVENFRQHGGDSIPDSQDLAAIVLSFWRELPPPTVLDAIDALLEQAKTSEDSGKMHITLKSGKGNAAFSSSFEYRLFQLLPVLQELDSSRAEALLREDQENKALMQQFPGGYGSLVPESQDTSKTSGESSGNLSLAYQFGSPSPEMIAFQLQEQWMEQVSQRREQIEKEATKDPRQATADALGLPAVSSLFPDGESPRAETLLAIGRMAAAGNPSASRTALEELHKSLADLSLVQQARLIIALGEVFLQLGDSESTRETVKDGLKIAEKLYARDTDITDPNQVIKAKWPSANAWWQLVSLAARISPAFASQVLAEIPDQEIATLAKVEFAKTLLGSPSSVPMRAQERHRDGVDRIVNF
jgi:hypothetical protein